MDKDKFSVSSVVRFFELNRELDRLNWSKWILLVASFSFAFFEVIAFTVIPVYQRVPANIGLLLGIVIGVAIGLSVLLVTAGRSRKLEVKQEIRKLLEVSA